MISAVFNAGGGENFWALDVHPKVIEQYLFAKIEEHSFELQKAEVRLFPLGGVFYWAKFVANLQQKRQQQKDFIPPPFDLVNTLVQKHLTQFNSGSPKHVMLGL